MPLRLLAAVLVLALGACTNTLHLRQAPEVRDSRFDPHVTVLGIERLFEDGALANPWQVHFLRSFVAKADGTAAHQLYVSYDYDRPGTGWIGWHRAADAAARPLAVVPVQSWRNCKTCQGRTEEFAVPLPEEALLAGRAAGYPIKLYGRDGSERVIVVTPRQIAAQLDAVAAVRARLNAERRRPRPPSAPSPGLP